jgi:exopolysaccharide biosynthesis protein
MEIDETGTPKKTILIRLTTVFLLIVSGILYHLADRYLIEHVQIANVSAAAAASSTELPQTVALNENVSVSSSQESSPATTTAFADDWNYQSDTVSIAIRQVSTGSGNKALTYFVADVVLSDATQLSSAFAKDSFGENIIEYTSQIASNNNAIFAINGDYYGFRSDSIVIRNGVIYRDIPARTGLAFYRDGSMKIYDETQTSAQPGRWCMEHTLLRPGVNRKLGGRDQPVLCRSGHQLRQPFHPGIQSAHRDRHH